MVRSQPLRKELQLHTVGTVLPPGQPLQTSQRSGASYTNPTVPKGRIETMGQQRKDSHGGRGKAASLAQFLLASTLEGTVQGQAQPNPQVARLRQEEAIWANQSSQGRQKKQTKGLCQQGGRKLTNRRDRIGPTNVPNCCP
jgi:hypothetical protein